jgi:hypothetical protein
MPPVSKPAPGSPISRRAERLVGVVLFQRRRDPYYRSIAHQTCPYSNATRGNIDVLLTLV